MLGGEACVHRSTSRDSTLREHWGQMPCETSLPPRRIVRPHQAQTTVIQFLSSE
jgi:hypothetical protein